MHSFLKQLGASIALLGIFLIGGCETPATTSKTANVDKVLPSGYTCCNFHHEGDWINDANYTTLPMIPAGTPATVTRYGRYRAYVTIGDQKMRLGLDYGREKETLEEWVSKMIVASDPNARIAAYPEEIQSAIREGKVAKGMTKEQVIVSVGYPLTSENASFDAPEWRMWVSSFGEYRIIWSENGRVKDIIADDLTKHVVYAER
jgi:hypothetical protein